MRLCRCSLRDLLLCNKFSGVKFHEHGAIGFEFLHRDRKPEVVEKQELQFEIVKLCQWKTSDLPKRKTPVS
jgi:hypothetical protein